MKRSLREFAFGVCLIALAPGCERGDSPPPDDGASRPNRFVGSESKSQSEPASPRDLGHAQDFFPSEVGLTWTYNITLENANPLRYHEIVWPTGADHAVAAATRGYYRSSIADEERKRFRLVLRSLAPASKQGPLEYPRGVELEVLEDELGVFEDARRVFWAIIEGSRVMVHQVVTYDPSISLGAPLGGPWGTWGQEEGHSIRLLMFGDRPGIQIGIGEDSADRLLFEGLDTRAAGFAGEPLLHFVRTVEGKSGGAGEPLDRAFTEDTWFARGKGLVRLEQRVGGELTMTWTLAGLTGR